MSKMAELDYKIKTIFRNIILSFIVIVIALLVYAEDYRAELQKENRIKVLEQRITKQEHYIQQLMDNIHETKEQEVLGR